MILYPHPCHSERRGVVAVLVAVLMIPLLAMVAFAVDYGYLLKVRTDLQRTADAASLAAVQSLIPSADGEQDLSAVRSAVQKYASANTSESFEVLDSDIEIGRYDPATIYSEVSLLNSGTLDAVRVTVCYDGTVNSPVRLFFAQALGINSAPVTATATAVLQKAATLEPGADVLPFAMPVDVWNGKNPGDTWSVYGDGKIKDSYDNDIPGNWGTVDIGLTANSTSDISNQIVNGLRQKDLDALNADSRIPSLPQINEAQPSYIDPTRPMWLNADTGISSGMKSAVQSIHGQSRLVPIFDSYGGSFNGNNLEFHIVGWGVVEVVDSNWGGAKDTWVKIRKAYMYDGDLRPRPDLSETTDVITGAYTSPVLVE